MRHGGSGPPVLLLHGHPRTHATWHRVAPLLARSHTVVCPDLRGYGESSKPPTTADHAPYAKRAMAADCLALMRALGHERLAVAGHDRGAYVALRTALDHPAAVTALAVLDAVPIGEALARCDARFAASWWHWFFYGQTAKAERVISADPDAWYGGDPERMGKEAYDDYRRAIHNPATVHAMMEDYRAGLGPDRDHDDEDHLRRLPGHLPNPGPVGHRGRPGGPLRRRPRRLAALGRQPPRPPVPLQPPHGRGGPRRSWRPSWGSCPSSARRDPQGGIHFLPADMSVLRPGVATRPAALIDIATGVRPAARLKRATAAPAHGSHRPSRPSSCVSRMLRRLSTQGLRGRIPRPRPG